MQESIQFLLSIDVEPKERLMQSEGLRDQWGLEFLIPSLDKARRAFRDRTGRPACFGWYWRADPQIAQIFGDAAWPMKKYADRIDGLLASGDECGLHPHAWRWDEKRGAWFTDNGDQDWVAHCVKTAFDAYEEFFGKPCKAIRFGDAWIDQATIDLVESLGAEFDLTLEPGRLPIRSGMLGEGFTGDFPDVRDAPRMPYRPSRADFRRPSNDGNGKFWIVPMSTGVVQQGCDGTVQAVTADADCFAAAVRRTRMHRAIRKAVFDSRVGAFVMRSGRARTLFNRACRKGLDVLTGGKPIEILGLNMIYDPAKFSALFDQALTQSQSRYIHTVLRSGDLENPRLRDYYAENLDFLINHPQAHRFEVSTPNRLVASWRQ